MAGRASHHPLLSNQVSIMTAALRDASHQIHSLTIGGSRLGRTVAQKVGDHLARWTEYVVAHSSAPVTWQRAVPDMSVPGEETAYKGPHTNCGTKGKEKGD